MFARKTIEPLSELISLPQDWMGSLNKLLTRPKGEFQTIEALLASVVDNDVVAGLMLKQILIWHSTLKREFYLDAKDWWEQCRAKRGDIDRAKKILPQCGISVEVKFSKLANANVTHYRVNDLKFMRRLAQVLNVSLLYLAERCVGIQQNVMSESSRTLTIESTIKTANDVVKNNVVPSVKVVDFKSPDLTPIPSPLRREGGRESTPEQLRVIELLKKAHVPGQRVVSFALLPETIVRDCIASAQSAFDAKRTKNRVGYLIGALKKYIKPALESAVTTAPPPNPLPKIPIPDPSPQAGKGTGGESEDGNFADSPLDTSWRLPKPVHTEAEPVNERLLVLVNERTTAQYAWSAAYQQLELQLDRASFDSYLRQAKLLDYEDGVFSVGVHNRYARDMLQHRFYRNVARILRDVTGREMTIRFEIYKNGKIISSEEPEAHTAPLRRLLRSNNDVH